MGAESAGKCAFCATFMSTRFWDCVGASTNAESIGRSYGSANPFPTRRIEMAVRSAKCPINERKRICGGRSLALVWQRKRARSGPKSYLVVSFRAGNERFYVHSYDPAVRRRS